MALYALHQAGKSFGSQHALLDIDLSIEAAEHIALVGSSGSGKTTLLKLLNAQHLATSGMIHFCGKDFSSTSTSQLRELRTKVSYIPQDLGLVSNLKVYQNILLGKIGHWNWLKMLKQFLLPSKAELERIFSILKQVGIEHKIYEPTASLSGGQQQRVAVARALFQEAKVILADEPTSSVDPARAQDLVRLLTSISQSHRLTLIMSIHNVELAKNNFQRFVGLRSGKLVFDTSAPSDADFQKLYQLSEQELSS